MAIQSSKFVKTLELPRVARWIPESARPLLRARPFPLWMTPMLATLTDRRFSSPEWLYEPKWDGQRCLSYWDGKTLALYSRNQKLLNGHYPELLAPLKKQRASSFVVDGEVVAFRGSVTSFMALQQRMGIGDPLRAQAQGVPIFYYLFDVLYLDGFDLTALPLMYRKTLLNQAFRFRDPVRLTPYLEEKGEAFYTEACKQGWEGVIAKRADSDYQEGRTPDWLKFKCVNVQEFVVGGYTDPQGARTNFGALLIGYYEGTTLRYAGKVGTGYNQQSLRDLAAAMKPLEVPTSPFADRDVPRRGSHWLKPRLVAQINFSEWTSDGRLRHPSFVGLRRDKSPREVVREKKG